MYRSILSLIIIVFLVSCKNNDGKLSTDMIQNPNTADGIDKSQKLPAISFKYLDHDFGKVIQGEVVTYNFKFTNTGNADLLISDVTTTCGCTVSEYPVDPVKPGETKIIKAIFDSNNRIGFQNKRITVLTNATPARYTLKIKADVLKPGQ